MNEMKKSLKKFYGSSKSPDKSILWVAGGFLAFAIVMLLLFLLNIDKHTAGSKYLSIYFLILFFEMPLLMLTLYCFQKKVEVDRFKFFKYTSLILSLVALSVIMMPVGLFVFLLHRLKFRNIYNYVCLYFVAATFSLFINVLIGALMYSQIKKLLYFDPLAIILTSLFLLNYFLMGIIGCWFFKHKVNKHEKIAKSNPSKNDEHLLIANNFKHDGVHFQKELYVLNYVIISFGTLAIHIFNLNYLFCNFNEEAIKYVENSVLYSFALYTAFDCLYEKWRKNLDEKSEITELKAEISVLQTNFSNTLSKIDLIQQTNSNQEQKSNSINNSHNSGSKCKNHSKQKSRRKR